MVTKPKQSSIQLATFLKWGFESFRCETTESDGRINVTKIWCKVCEEHIDRIKTDDKFHGQTLKDIETFIYTCTCTSPTLKYFNVRIPKTSISVLKAKV